MPGGHLREPLLPSLPNLRVRLHAVVVVVVIVTVMVPRAEQIVDDMDGTIQADDIGELDLVAVGKDGGLVLGGSLGLLVPELILFDVEVQRMVGEAGV